MLEPDEPVLALAFSTHAGRWWQEVRATKSDRLIVATDRRLKLLPGGMLLAENLAAEAEHPRPEWLPYSEIQGIGAKLGRWEAKLDIFTVSRTVRLTSMRAKGASSVADVVRAHI
jgi:hypothetical protein